LISPDHNIDVLLWIALRPVKRGSLEDYLIAMAKGCRDAGLIAHIVMIDPGEEHRGIFDSATDFSHEYLSKEDHTRGFVLLRYILKLKPKILHLQFYGLGTALIPWARLAFRGYLVIHDHTSREIIKSRNGTWTRTGEIIRRLRTLVILKMIDLIIPVSNFLAVELFRETSVSGDKVKMIYNGIDIERFRPPRDIDEKRGLAKQLLGNQESIPLVTFVGALTSSKGIEDFIEVAEKLLLHGAKVRFVISGDGSMQEMITQRCSADKRHLRYLGLRNDVPEILRSSDIFVAPYRWQEAFGLTIAEASASGIPVVASDVGAIHEIIDDEVTGVLIKPGNTDAMYKEILRLLNDDDLRDNMGKAAKSRVEELFSLGSTIKQTIDVYQHYLS
jgi:glycosyltransferase involved in cell wall biosynthesis